MQKSWHLDRRTFLHGCGVALALPQLDCMAAEAATAPAKRFCAVYFPYGIVNRNADDEQAKWNWFPTGTGKDFQFTDTLSPLEPVRHDLSILRGLSHINGRKMGGHDTADIWLTGAEFKGNQFQNSVSIDQLIAEQHGRHTRYSSLVMSSDGGVGEPTRSSTLSFSRNGQPVPAQNKPRVVFDRLFGIDSDSLVAQRQRLKNSGSMLDLILDHSKSLRNQLGNRDQQKLDEYLSAVRQIEQRVERAEGWLEVPKPNVPATGLNLDADDSTPRELIRTMYDLMFLAFQTDSTRVATYQIGNMNGATSIAGKFPQLLGLSENMHKLAHGAQKKSEPKGKWDQFLADQMAYFLGRLKATPEGGSTLLDNTVIMYGSSNCQTHRNENYPIMIAGGNALGLKHGRLHDVDDSVPMTNLLVTILNRMSVPTESFVDSTGELTAIV